MASLNGQQINNTYVGLLKTDDNLQITGKIEITDGVGTSTGAFINTNGTFELSQAGNPAYIIKNEDFNRSSAPMSLNPNAYTDIQFQDTNGDFTGYISQDRFGSISYKNLDTFGTSAHVFQSYSLGGGFANSKIAIDSFSSANNSDNWFTGYNERITAGSYNGGTGDLTLTKPGSTDIVVNIPAGGGGSAGLVQGTVFNAMQSAASLSDVPAVANKANAIAIGNGAEAYTSGQISIGLNAGSTSSAHYGSISIGANSEVTSFGAIAIGGGGVSAGQSAIAIGDQADANTEATAIGREATAGSAGVAIGTRTTANSEATAIGFQCNATNFTAFAMGVNSNNAAEDSSAIGSNININAGSFNVALGQGHTINGGDRLTIVGGVGVTAQDDNYTSIGNAISPTGTHTNSVAIGSGAGINNVADAVAIGNVIADRSNFVTVEQLQVKTTGGGIIMASPDGTLYKLTVANGGTLSISAV
jgi:hypothetical protein